MTSETGKKQGSRFSPWTCRKELSTNCPAGHLLDASYRTVRESICCSSKRELINFLLKKTAKKKKNKQRKNKEEQQMSIIEKIIAHSPQRYWAWNMYWGKHMLPLED